ncbi:MAG: hypothetical protein LUJ09_01010 [Firmicutes bacterium]|nr:hypothetical protein [Bacillota bacterium]
MVTAETIYTGAIGTTLTAGWTANSGSSKTADTFPLGLLAVLCVLSAAGLVLVADCRRSFRA